MCGRVLTGDDWWWSRVYGRDNVHLAFSDDGPFSEIREFFKKVRRTV